MHHRISLLGCPIDALTLSETMAEVERIITSRKPSQHCPVNASVLVWLQQDNRLLDVIGQSAIVNADGQALIWASRLLGMPLPERVTGPDLMENLVGLAALKNYRVYFLGAMEEVVQQMIDVFKDRYSGLQVAGYHHGYFLPGEEQHIVDSIRNSQADMLFVALSTPQKDYFINSHLNEMRVPFCMGVGGTFDVLAGKVKRAPMWMQQAGLEWFHRFLQEPHRMWKRYLVTNTVFLWLVFRAYILHKFSKR